MKTMRFTPGDKVEVSCDDEGFRGSWFEATVARSMPKSRRYAVVYDSLTCDEDESQPLRETVLSENVRPRPPRRPDPGGGRFSLHEAVEAYHNDGWWIGVVSKVHGEDGEKYTVNFPNSREEMEFQPSDLRAHLDWVNGDWLTLEQQQQGIKDIMFSSGTQVEVLRVKGNSLTAWFAATIVKLVGKNNFLVEYESLQTDNRENLKEIVDPHYIRPCPPLVPDAKAFDLLDEVEAFFSDGWCAGVISKIYTGSRYIVNSTHWEGESEFGQSELRLRHDWIDGRWIRTSTDKCITSQKPGGTKSVVKKQQSYARNISQKANASIDVTTSSGSLEKGTNLERANEKGSTFEGQICSSPPCKKSRTDETLKGISKLIDCLKVAGVADTSTLVETKFDVATPTLEERGIFELNSPLENEQHHPKSPSIMRRAENLLIASNISPNPSLEVLNDESHVPLIFNQEPFVQQTPLDITEQSICGKKQANLEGEGSEHQLKAVNFYSSSISHAISDFTPPVEWGQCKRVRCPRMNNTPKKRENSLRYQRRCRRKVRHNAGIPQEADKKKRGRPPKAKSMVTQALLESTEPKNLEELPDVVAEREYIVGEVTRSGISVSGDVSCGIPEPCHGDKEMNVVFEGQHVFEELESSAVGDKATSLVLQGKYFTEEVKMSVDKGNSSGDDAVNVHWANEQLNDMEGSEPSNESHSMLQQEPVVGGGTSKKDEQVQKLSEVTVSSGTMLAEIPTYDIQQNVASRKELNEALHMSLGGQDPKNIIVVKKSALTGNSLGDDAFNVHRANEKLSGKGVGVPLSESNSIPQLESDTGDAGGNTSNNDQTVQRPSQMAVSSSIRSETISKFDIQLNGTPREEQDKALQMPLRGKVSESIVIVKKTAVTDMVASVSPSRIHLPFVKSSPIWEQIEAMEAFRAMPQQPHYWPLEQYREELREGMAIGLMVTFTNLAANMHKLRIDDPDVIFEEKLKTLVHLEGHGFNVQCIQARLQELLRIKGNQCLVEQKRVALEEKISELHNEGHGLDTEIYAIDKRLVELEEERASIIAHKESNDAEIVKLQMDLQASKQARLSAEHDFGTVIAAAW